MSRMTLLKPICSLIGFGFIGISGFGSPLLAQTLATESDIVLPRYELGSTSEASRAVQRDGSMTIEEELAIVNGTYEMQGGKLSMKNLQLSNRESFVRWPGLVELPTTPRPTEPMLPTTVLPWLSSFDPTLTVDPTGPFVRPVPTFDPISDDVLDFFPTPLIREQTFHQIGGEVSISDSIDLQSGNVTVDGGIFSAKSMVINAQAFGFLASQFQQNGGETNFDSILIDNGRLELNEGTLSANSLAMGDPASQTESFLRSPEVIQNGGNMEISGNLELCIPGFTPGSPGIWPTDPIELFPFESVTYRLGDGNLNVAGDLIVGSMGAAPAEFTQTGGVSHVGGALRIEGEGSIYSLQSGELSVDRLHVATNLFNTQGAFSLSNAATLNVSEEVILGADANFVASFGSTLNFSGSTFSILGSDATALAGLDSLSLVIAGGASITSLEVAGKDLGNVDEGFDLNFSLESLQIGDEDAAHVRLVDLIKNHFEQPSSDALYVDTLQLSAGSILELNGLEIYYRELQLGENASIIGEAIAIPEPTTLLPFLLGFVSFSSIRRRRKATS